MLADHNITPMQYYDGGAATVKGLREFVNPLVMLAPDRI